MPGSAVGDVRHHVRHALTGAARLSGVGAIALAIVAVAGCGSTVPTPTPGTSSGATEPPSPTPFVTPTPVPTPLGTPGSTPGTAEGADLVVRVTECAALCVPTPGTTLLRDGRVIWAGPNERVLTTRLTSAGLARVRDAVARRPELAEPAEYYAELLPGAEPFPRGTTVYRFDVGGAAPDAPDRHAVVIGDPSDYALEPDLWIIPPEMVSLAPLARQILNPVGWLGTDALAEPIRPYQPDRYLVLVELFPGVGSMPEFRLDIDAIDSPFGAPFETLGEAVQVDEGGFPVRCLVTDAETGRMLAAAENAAGVPRDPEAWSSGFAYRWDRGEGFVQVTLRQALPHQAHPCAELELELA